MRPDTVFWLSVGVVAAAAYVLWAGSMRVTGRRRIYATGLVIAAAIYPVFALVAGDFGWLGIELLGVLVYTLFARAGLRRSDRWLAFGWLLHPVWDLGLHLQGMGAEVAPYWYVMACLSFDAVVAAAILMPRSTGDRAGES